MKTSLRSAARAPWEGRGENTTGERERKQGQWTGYAWGPGHQHRRSGLQRCRLGWVRPPERILEAAWVTHPALWQARTVGRCLLLAACPVHVGAAGAAGRGRYVALRAGGACELLPEATMGSRIHSGPRARGGCTVQPVEQPYRTADSSAAAASPGVAVSPGGDRAGVARNVSLTPTYSEGPLLDFKRSCF